MLKSSPLLGACLALFALPSFAQDFEPVRPNVVLIGHPELSELMLSSGPNIQALAAKGAVIPQAEVTIPRGIPELAVLMTGLLPQVSGVRRTTSNPKLDSLTTLADLLRSEGYANFGAGNAPAPWSDMAFDATHDEINPLSLDGRNSLGQRLEELGPEQPFFLWWCPASDGRNRGEEQAEALAADNQIGQLVQVIKRAGQHDNTLYVIVNTGEPNNNPERRRTRASVRQSPFVFSYADKIQRGKVHDVFASSLDVFPTILDFAGADAEGLQLAGKSLRPLLEEGTAFEREVLYGAIYSKPESTVSRFALADENLNSLSQLYSRDRRWKFVLCLVDVRLIVDKSRLGFLFSEGEQELFDLQADPDELLNLAGVPEHAETLVELRRGVLDWWESTGATPPRLQQLIVPLEPLRKGSRKLDERPNIVLLIADDQDPAHLGFMGNAQAKMPILDGLAEAGTVFSMAHSTASRSRPALATLLTGRYPHQTRITANRALTELRTKNSLPNLLKDSGYATFMGGQFMEQNRYAMGFTSPDWEDVNNFVRTDQDALLEFLDAQAAKRPFFIWWAPKIPSEPFNAPGRFRDLVREVEISVPSSFEGNKQDYIRLEKDVMAMEAWFDEGLGQLIEKIKALGELDNTLFCYLSNNGSSHLRPSRGSIFEKGMHIPIMFSFNGKIKAGQRLDDLTSSVDIFPTLLDYAKVELPNGLPGRSLRPVLEGGSMDESLRREYLIGAGYRGPRPSGRPQPHSDIFALYVRDHEWKYVYYLRNLTQENTSIMAPYGLFPARDYGTVELFDLRQDPHEYNNVAQDPKHAERLARMHDLALEWWSSTGGIETKLFKR